MKQTRLTLFALALIAAVLLLGSHPPTAHAADRTVCASGCTDTTITAAIAAATDGDTITVLDAVHTEQGITINKSLTIQGQGAGSTIVQAHATAGSATDRVFLVNYGVTATIQGMTIRHGNTGNTGGGIYNEGALTVNNSALSDNSADEEGGGIYNEDALTVNNSALSGNLAYRGGGIYNIGTLTVNNSALSGNLADEDGGGISNDSRLTVNNSAISGNSAPNGGGINTNTISDSCAAEEPRTIIRNTTLSNNLATANGGGLRNNNGVTEITNSTITANSAGSGGGVWSYNDNLTCTRVGGTIIAGNNSDDVAASSTVRHFFSLGHNLIGTAGANVNFDFQFNQTGDMTDTAPSLGALADNGGPTRTHRPNSDSPAIDNGAAGCGVTIDQRGAERPYNTNCDIGAVETHPIAQNCTLTTDTDLAIGDLTFNVANWGTLACIKVEDMGAVNHLLATPGIQTGQWWHVFGEDSLGNRVTSGFGLRLTLPHSITPDSNAKVCKFPGTQGGYGWDCARTDSDGTTVWLDGVDSFSDWAVANFDQPTAVTLLDFGVAPVDETALRITWSTASELDVRGFHLWRSQGGERSQALRITQEIIETQGDMLFGADYLFVDGPLQAESEYSYWLQEMAADGSVTEYGPVTARPSAQDGAHRFYLPFLNR